MNCHQCWWWKYIIDTSQTIDIYIYILYQNKYVYIYIPTIFFPPTARPVFLWSRHVPQKQRPPTHIWAPNDGRMQLQSNQDEGIRNLPKALHLSGKLPSGQRLIQWTGLRENWNRKAPYLMGKSMVSCKCSLKPIHWFMGKLTISNDHAFNHQLIII